MTLVQYIRSADPYKGSPVVSLRGGLLRMSRGDTADLTSQEQTDAAAQGAVLVPYTAPATRSAPFWNPSTQRLEDSSGQPITGIGGVSAFGAQDSALARWAPPAFRSTPTVVALPTTFFNNGGTRYDQSTDILFTPNAASRVASFDITGGRTVRIVGGSLVHAGSGTGYRVRETTEAVFFEGLFIDMAALSSDAINVQGNNGYIPDVYIENSRIENVNGTTAGTHADVFQAQGPIGRLFIDLLTFTSNYQGLFVRPQFAIGGMWLSRINARYNANASNPTTYLFWFRNTDGTQPSNPDPIYLDEVYVEPRAGQTLLDCVQPGPGVVNVVGQDIGAILSADGKFVTWPSAARIFGKVKLGPPPGGDFVPAANVGLGYTPRGYIQAAPSQDPSRDGRACTMPVELATSNSSSSGTNRTTYLRIPKGQGRRACTKLTVHIVGVGTGGNLTPAVYPNNGLEGRSAAPAGPAKIIGSATAAAGTNVELDLPLGGTVDVNEGDWVAIGMDTTGQVTLARPQANPAVAAGMAGKQAVQSVYPPPTTPASLFTSTPFWFVEAQ